MEERTPKSLTVHLQCLSGSSRFFVTAQGAPINESDHCGDPPLLLAAGNGELENSYSFRS